SRRRGRTGLLGRVRAEAGSRAVIWAAAMVLASSPTLRSRTSRGALQVALAGDLAGDAGNCRSGPRPGRLAHSARAWSSRPRSAQRVPQGGPSDALARALTGDERAVSRVGLWPPPTRMGVMRVLRTSLTILTVALTTVTAADGSYSDSCSYPDSTVRGGSLAE